MQNTLQEVLQAVSQFSGVDLPGTSPTSPADSDSLPTLGSTNLKDRIRTDLEAFSARKASELSKQAEEKARAALGALESELNDQIERVTGELREKMEGRLATEQWAIGLVQQSKDRIVQLVQAQTDEFARWVWLTCKGTGTPTPPQMQKLLEPYIEEATADFASSFRQKAKDLIAEQEQLVQEKLQAAADSVQSQLGSLEQAALQVCEQNADSVAKRSSERLNAAADEVVEGVKGRIGKEVEGALGRFQARLGETSEAARADLQREQDLRAEDFRRRLEGMAKEAQEMGLSEISSRIAQSAADLIESSIQHLHHQTEDSLEHSRSEISAFMKLEMNGVQQQVRDMGLTAHQALDRELAAATGRHLSTSLEQLDGMVQERMASMQDRIRQAADQALQEASQKPDALSPQLESRLVETVESRCNGMMARIQQEADQAAQRVAAGAKAASEALLRELSGKANASAAALREEADQVSRRIESALQQSLEAHSQQIAQVTQAGLAEQKEALSGKVAELNNRLKQAAELLMASVPTAQ